MVFPSDNILKAVAEQNCLTTEMLRAKLEGLRMFCPEVLSLIDIYEKQIQDKEAETQRQRERIEALEKNMGNLSMELIKRDAVIERLEANEKMVWEEKLDMEQQYKELRELQAEAAPRTKKKCISFNALLVRIGAVMSRLGSAASENIADCFEKGFDRQWMDEFWRALYDRPDWVQWLTDDSSLKYKNFLMVIGKLMSLRVFKRDTSKLSSCFDFPIMERSKKHYLTDGANFFAEKHPELNCWIEEYVATHLAS
ncbi:MAG: hypothetical protein KBT33_09515 [Prevotellaceae bacterium]|nr:hypothetical protein [Candidatus Minthosoma equi]